MAEEVPTDHVPTKVAKNNNVRDESAGNMQPDKEMAAYRRAVMEHAFAGPSGGSRQTTGSKNKLDANNGSILSTEYTPAIENGTPSTTSTPDVVVKPKPPVKFTDPTPASTAAIQTSEHDTATASKKISVATLSMKALLYHKNSLISGKLVVDQRNLLFEATPGSDRRKNYLTIGMHKVIIIPTLSELWLFDISILT